MSTSSDEGHTIGAYAEGDLFLRMDGSGVTEPVPDGGGTVNCQVDAGPWEKFNFEQQPDGGYAIGSIAFPGVYLRMDGRGVSEASPQGGKVNCQFGVGPWEKFKVQVPPMSYGVTIESVAFPGVFLRMDTDGCGKNSAPGCGQVGCRWGASREAPNREWFILSPMVTPDPQDGG